MTMSKPHISFGIATSHDLKDATALIATHLGGEPELKINRQHQIFIARSDDEVAGVVTASWYENPIELIAAYDLDDLTRAELSSHLAHIDGAIAQIDQVVVDPGYRGQGIAKQLLQAALDWVNQHDISTTITFAWVYPDGSCPLAPVAESIGAENVVELTNFWQESYRWHGWECPACGAKCRCTARLYVIA